MNDTSVSPQAASAIGFRRCVWNANMARVESDGATDMTRPSRKSQLSRDRRMDDVKQELTRAMEQEMKFRAAERTDRVRQLGLTAADEFVAKGLQPIP